MDEFVVFVMRNNKPAAVLLAVDEYQHLRSLRALHEHLEDAQMIHEALRADDGIRHNLDDVLAIGPRNDLAVYQNSAQELKRLGRHCLCTK